MLLQNETHEHFPRLAVIADDLTGSFDTGVQFQKRGAAVKVAFAHQLPETLQGLDVLVIDAETRHTSPEETYARTLRLVRWTMDMGVPQLYIKTDSGLRGNIGMTMKAALDMTGAKLIAFAPAYPDMKRTTVQGRQLIDGVPLQDSVFGHDLFDPVNASGIRDLLTPAGLTVREYPVDEPYDTCVDAPTVAVFDAETNEDLDRVAAHLASAEQLRITAGCAAFASRLTKALGLPCDMQAAPMVTPPLLVVCGSLNPITRAQMEYGEDAGHTRCSLALAELLDASWREHPADTPWLQALRDRMRRGEDLLLDTGMKPPAEGACGDVNTLRQRIAENLGCLMLALIRTDAEGAYSPMIIGGDTLMGFLAQLDNPGVLLTGEIVPGVVSFSVDVDGRRVNMLSKSGGFGRESLLQDLVTQAVCV